MRFDPIYFTWKKSLTTRVNISVIIMLPSGNESSYGLCAVNEERSLLLKVVIST